MATPAGADSPRKRRRRDAPPEPHPDAAAAAASYAGYVFGADAADDDVPPVLDRVDAAAIAPAAFFRDYVARRRPCVLTGPAAVPPALTGAAVRREAGRERVQVERRAAPADAFGQNRTPELQREMALEELFRRWEATPEDRELYYLSTQAPPADADGADPFLGPCRALRRAGLLPPALPLAGNLRLESCNLWMGRATGSSGLHHDFHDNYYLLAEGRKRFRLYAPREYPAMATHGALHRMHENGLISYQSEPTRSDGIPLRLIQDENSIAEGDTEEEEDSDDDEENVVLGKGFDYVSSDDEEVIFSENDVDDYDDQFLRKDEDTASTAQDATSDVSRRRPDSFSVIDPTLPRSILEHSHPEFCKAKECIVELQAGEALYLPASWFHCVTSSPGSEKLHLAVNYWYYPPSRLDNFDEPYTTDFWGYRPKANDLIDQKQ